MCLEEREVACDAPAVSFGDPLVLLVLVPELVPSATAARFGEIRSGAPPPPPPPPPPLPLAPFPLALPLLLPLLAVAAAVAALLLLLVPLAAGFDRREQPWVDEVEETEEGVGGRMACT